MICAGCGAWISEPDVRAEGSGVVLACALCGHREPYRRLPLFALTGPSGTGKSTVGRRLVGLLDARAVVLEQDLLWVGALRDPAGDSAAFRQTWLRLAASVQQSGRPVVLCGTVAPPQFERIRRRLYWVRVSRDSKRSERERFAARHERDPGGPERFQVSPELAKEVERFRHGRPRAGRWC